MDENEKKAEEMEADYRKMVDFTHPKFWITPIEVFQHPEATQIKSVPALRKDGSVTLFHYPLDADGGPCGEGENNSNPCPPFC